MTSTETLDRGLTVQALARSVGVRGDTVRYYERAGLLPPPPRTSGDHRRYDRSAVDRLRFIQGAQRLGLRLAEIRELLAIRDTGVCPCEPAEQFLAKRLAELDAELARLRRLRREIADMLARLPTDSCPELTPGSWLPPATT